MNEKFDRLADRVAEWVASAYFFGFCVLIILLWLLSYLVITNLDTWQLIINTFTTIVTFLMVALLHNTQHRFERATNERLFHLLEHLHDNDPVEDEGQKPDSQK